jgi:6-phosphogluconolactonase (cycloisomerase 2 family)
MHSSRACCALLFAMLLAGCGSSGAPPTLKLTPQLALVTNYSTQTGDPYTVSAFTVNSSDGSLTQISGSPFSVGNGPNSLAVDPAGKFAYVADVGSFDITVLSISGEGVLAAVAGSPFATGNNPQAITMHKSGKFLYVATVTPSNPTPGAIWAYSVDASTGAIMPLAESPFPAGQLPSSITTDSSGMFLYTTDIVAGQVLGYSIDQSTGALTPIPGSLSIFTCRMDSTMMFRPTPSILRVAG